jgi:hypothetical protein
MEKQIKISELKGRMYSNENNFEKYLLTKNRRSVIAENEYALIKVIKEPRQWKVNNTVFTGQLVEAILCENDNGVVVQDNEQINIYITLGDYNLLTKSAKKYPKIFKVMGTVYKNRFGKAINGRKWVDEEKIDESHLNKNKKEPPKKELYLE